MANKKKRNEKRREARMRQTAKKERLKEELKALLDDIQDGEVHETWDEKTRPEEETGEDNKVKEEYKMYHGPTSVEEAGIIYSQDMTPEVKSEHIRKSFDMELLELNAIIAIDERNTPAIEKIGDWIRKAVLSESRRKELSDSDFALVYEENGKKVRKYPIHDKAHVRNALARAAQMLNEGGKAARDARRALPKIRAAAKKMGIGMEKNSIVIEKDAKGEWRAVLWPTNNFRDRDGEIIKESAHAEYVEWVNKNMDLAPVFMTWHIPGTARTHPIDFVGYENGFMIQSVPLTEEEAARLLIMQSKIDIGLSIGGLALERDEQDPKIITKYRMYEVSDLPLDRASNPFTDFQVFAKEVDDMDTLKYLANILGDEEKAKAYIERAGIKQAELRKAGVAEKEVAAPAETALPANGIPQPKVATVNLDEVIARVAKEFGMDQLSKEFAILKEKANKVDALEKLVKELLKSHEDQFVEMITPPAASAFAWMKKRASESDETLLDDNDENDRKLKKSKPEYWLSEATGTQPIQVP